MPMNEVSTNSDKVVYVVAGQKKESINQRVARILTLGKSFDKMMLVSPGNGCFDNNNIAVKPLPNPTGIFRLMKLDKLKTSLDRYLYFPSRYILYVKAAQRILKKAISDDLKKGKRVCVLTELPPHDSVLVGLFFKRQFPDIYWLIDWRDLWSYDGNYFERIPDCYKNRVLKLEKEVLHSCDMNITTNLKAKEVLEKEYGVSSDRVVSINQHFCREDLGAGFSNQDDDLVKDKKGTPVKIGFLGTLFKPPRVPGSRVLKAIDYVIDSGINVELHLYGGATEDGIKLIKGLRNDAVHVYERVSHVESLRRISQCRFLLLVLADLPTCKAVMSIKLPQYLLLGLPILAIVPEESAIADIIRKTGSGYVIPAGCDWSDGLKKVLQDYLNGKNLPERNNEAIEAYSWENISKQWMEVFSGAWK
jgi:glycosyltransferase involved in cell wall biosynthesis